LNLKKHEADMNEYDLDILRLHTQGFCCAQIVLQMALEMQGVENPGLIRAMSGLCVGFSSPQGACGALTGAACLVAYHAGKGTAQEQAHDRLPLMLAELAEWYEEYAAQRFGGISCSAIVPDGKPDASICGGLVSECFGKAMTILVENGFDPSSDIHG
jgi:hypothetical protein